MDVDVCLIWLQPWRATSTQWVAATQSSATGASQRRAEVDVPTEQILPEWSIGTDPAVHIQKMQALFESAATVVTIHAGRRQQARVIDFYRKQALPALPHPA